jgi:hypothetical protein
MSLSQENGIVIIDNANSGTNTDTTVCAARYARHCAGTGELTLVIGQAEGDGAVCEGFFEGQILDAIEKVRPSHVILVGRYPGCGTSRAEALRGMADAFCTTLEEGRTMAVRRAQNGSIVLSVKTWR